MWTLFSNSLAGAPSHTVSSECGISSHQRHSVLPAHPSTAGAYAAQHCLVWGEVVHVQVRIQHTTPKHTHKHTAHPLKALTWLCRARKDTGESMASRDLAHTLTTFSPVRWIFSVSWSTAMLLGAHTNTCLWGREAGTHTVYTVLHRSTVYTHNACTQCTHLHRN